MRRWVTGAALLMVVLLLSACGRTSTDTRDTATVDPSEAFYPLESVRLDQTGTWGGFKLSVERAEAMVHKGDIRDIDLTAYVVFTNLGSGAANPPKDVSFEFAGKSYPGTPTDEPIPGGATAKRPITGTLTSVAKSDPPSRDEMHDILVNTRLVFGAPGTTQTVFPFTER